jgi:aminomethyltransferase
VQARLVWAVGWDKPVFWGADALRAERAAKPARVLIGVRHAGRRIPRPGMAVYADDGSGASIGIVTSGTFGPTAGAGIGLALVERRRARAGNQVWLDMRGRREPYELVKPPFVEVDPGD